MSLEPTVAPPPQVPDGLAAFLTGLIDYAGLFPPARLPLEEAVPNFAAYRHTEDAWMLGRFICPAPRLADLARYTDLFRPEAPFPVSVLGTGGGDAEAFFVSIREDLAAVASFVGAHPGRVRPDLLEVRLPPPVVEAGSRALRSLLDRLADALAPRGFDRVFLEVSLTEDGRRAAGEAAEALGSHPAPLGMKLRCGGLTPDAFPTPEQLAFAIAQCRDAGLPFKATAGLHHPVRHHSQELEVTRHGFLNVFGAGVLAHALDLSEQALRQVLRSEDLQAFALDDEGFAFQDLRITTSQLQAARSFATSYGSCSFDEPRDDLRAAGLL